MFPSLLTPLSLLVLSFTLFAFAADAQEPTLVRPKHPAVVDRDWPRIPLDRFILAKLEAKGTKPPTEADKQTLLRRATLDLTGEAPTPDELAAISADKAWNAYEKAVDRLLSSPRSTEWMVRRWMGLVGSDDTDHREWLRKAIADNMPLDRFVAEQADDSRWSPKIRERVLAISGIARSPSESARDAVRRQRAKMARTVADHCWRTLMKTDACNRPRASSTGWRAN